MNILIFRKILNIFFKVRFSYKLIKDFLDLWNFIRKKIKSLINLIKDLISLIKNSEILIRNLEIRLKGLFFLINRLRIFDFNLRDIIKENYFFWINKELRFYYSN